MIAFVKTQNLASLWEILGKQVQLVFGEVQILGNLIFVCGNKPFYILLNQLDGRRLPGFAVIAQRTVLTRRQLEGNRMVVVIATLPLFVLLMSHNTLV